MENMLLEEPAAETSISRFAILQPILCCPQARDPLRLVALAQLQARLPDGVQVPPGTVGAFVSESRSKAYPILGRIASFLESDAISLTGEESSHASFLDADGADVKQSVKKWYDEYGWKRSQSGQYYDTALFSQRAPTGHGLYEMSSHLAIVDRLAGGEFVLDAASGAIAHPEYLAYSWFYRYRICVDMSLTALQEADAKIGDAGFCCLADICRLPFRDHTMDGAVSGYTIDHIPASQQLQAVKELFRTLRPGKHVCLIVGVQHSWWHGALVRTCQAVRKVLRLLRIIRPRPPAQAPAVEAAPPPHQLYYHVRRLNWWREAARQLTKTYSLECMRVFTIEEFELLFGDSNRAAKLVRAWETAYPRLAARFSHHCLIDLCKE